MHCVKTVYAYTIHSLCRLQSAFHSFILSLTRLRPSVRLSLPVYVYVSMGLSAKFMLMLRVVVFRCYCLCLFVVFFLCFILFGCGCVRACTWTQSLCFAHICVCMRVFPVLHRLGSGVCVRGVHRSIGGSSFSSSSSSRRYLSKVFCTMAYSVVVTARCLLSIHTHSHTQTHLVSLSLYISCHPKRHIYFEISTKTNSILCHNCSIIKIDTFHSTIV